MDIVKKGQAERLIDIWLVCFFESECITHLPVVVWAIIPLGNGTYGGYMVHMIL